MSNSEINRAALEAENKNSIINQVRWLMTQVRQMKGLMTNFVTLEMLPQEFISPAAPVQGGIDPTDPNFTGSFVAGRGRVFSINGVDTQINIGGVNAGTFQVGFGQVDGIFYAAAGKVTADNDGLSVYASTSYSSQTSYKFKNTAGDDIGGMRVQSTASGNAITLQTENILSRDSLLFLATEGATGRASSIALQAYSDDLTLEYSEIRVDAPNRLISLNYGSYDIDTVINGADRAVITVDASTNTAKISRLNTVRGADLTISGGAVTITHSWHRIDTESAAATDDLDTINGGNDGDILILSSVNNARDTTVKDATGNIDLAGGDFTFTNARDRLMLQYDGTSSFWLELSRSDNT